MNCRTKCKNCTCDTTNVVNTETLKVDLHHLCYAENKHKIIIEVIDDCVYINTQYAGKSVGDFDFRFG